MTTGASPSDTSSSRTRRGLVISARPIAAACRSPPERLPASASLRARSIGKSSITVSERPVAAPADPHRDLKVFLDRHAAEQPPALGHERDASRDPLVRAHRA